MSIQAVQMRTAEHHITSLLVAMSVKVDEAVNRAISALLDSHSHDISGLMENAVVIQEMEILIDQAVFAALERGEVLLVPADLVQSEVV